MEIFSQLKSSEDRNVVRVLNKYLKYSVRLGQAEGTVEFLNICVQTNIYPKFHVKSLRRSGVRPNLKALKRYASSQIEAQKSCIAEIQKNIDERFYAVEGLPELLKDQFLNYVTHVSDANKVKRRTSLLESLTEKASEIRFSSIKKQQLYKDSQTMLTSPESMSTICQLTADLCIER
ncbi:unnamed protein product [Schistosoma margrebowiei]|uniref:Uncharacterized protein n=1 Tax=Schistosoma margrebowiei TaxID=48269 RepID=A0A183LBT7_9TREM|nr:unnamed protein product [Schistosoma margrebowiei]